MESDAEINRSDFLENIFDCFVTDGSQMYVPVNFDIYAFYGKESDLGAGNGWTIDEFLDLAGKKDMFFNTSGSLLLRYLVYADLNGFVDRENKKCSFNDGRFEKVLEYIYMKTAFRMKTIKCIIHIRKAVRSIKITTEDFLMASVLLNMPEYQV